MLSPWGAYGYKFQLVGDKPVGYFTNMAKDLNLGLQRTNPAGLGASQSQVQCP